MKSDQLTELFKKFWSNDAVRAFAQYGPAAFHPGGPGRTPQPEAPATEEQATTSQKPPGSSQSGGPPPGGYPPGSFPFSGFSPGSFQPGSFPPGSFPGMLFERFPWGGSGSGSMPGMPPFPMPFNPMAMNPGASFGKTAPGSPFPFPLPPWFAPWSNQGGGTNPQAPQSNSSGSGQDTSDEAVKETSGQDSTATETTGQTTQNDPGDPAKPSPGSAWGIPDDLLVEWMRLHKRMLEAMEHYLAHFNSTDDTWLQQMMKAQFQFFVQMAKRYREEQDTWVRKQQDWLADTIAQMDTAIEELERQIEEET